MTDQSESPLPSAPSSVVILGAGTMGVGIALTFARAGTRVAVTARRQITLDQARRRLDETLQLMARHRIVPLADVEHVLTRIQMAPFDRLDLKVDLVIESIIEDAPAKIDILGRAEAAALPTTIIATNTSSLSLRALSESLERPQNFAGFHWFNPPEMVALVEVISGPRTDRSVIAKLIGWSSAIGKQPVAVRREIDGFIANRLQYALMREAYELVEDGVCSLDDVDVAMRACLGPRWAGVGPFEAMDLAGLDIHLEVASRLFPLLSNRSDPPALLQRLVSDGALGTKTGRGLYGEYDGAAIHALRERRMAALLAMSELAHR